jgi:hypothetical protein
MQGESLRCRLVRRLAVVGAALAIVVAVGLVLGLRGGSSGDKAVAHVAGEPITKDQLEAVVAHFRTEAGQKNLWRRVPAHAVDEQ